MTNIDVTFSVPAEQFARFEQLMDRASRLLRGENHAPAIPNFLKSIFISYRRSDSAYITGRIYDRLVQAFGPGSVFRDVDDLLAGRNFTEALERELAASDLMLVIIGSDWLTVTDGTTGQRRLDNASDIVRLEVETGLERGIPLIPVLVRGASMPKRAELPLRLKPLADKSGMTIDPDPRFHADVDHLIEKILQTLMEN
jgi:hypothetical protein